MSAVDGFVVGAFAEAVIVRLGGSPGAALMALSGCAFVVAVIAAFRARARARATGPADQEGNP